MRQITLTITASARLTLTTEQTLVADCGSSDCYRISMGIADKVV
ncbi:hypothetical protein [Novipirellula aureliae]|nr:hypothetical protein [Novipirellula aureliae]